MHCCALLFHACVTHAHIQVIHASSAAACLIKQPPGFCVQRMVQTLFNLLCSVLQEFGGDDGDGGDDDADYEDEEFDVVEFEEDEEPSSDDEGDQGEGNKQ